MPKITFFEAVLFTLFAIFSALLMFSGFSYQDGSMFVATRAWSDFASHIPLIRSFSFGENFPPQYPLFSGPPIHYHFLFYAFVGFLENMGINIALALNTLSSFGFMVLLITLYLFIKVIFKSKIAALLSVLFLIFNGSLGFTFFLEKNPFIFSIQGISDFINNIIFNKDFTSFGPYDGKIVSAFWNLNIYTNQRHLALAFAISLLMILTFLLPVFSNKKHKKTISLLLGFLLCLLFFFHLAVFLMTVVALITLAFFFPSLINSAFIIFSIGALLSLPQYLYLQSGDSGFKLLFNPGYLISNNFNLINFLNYWFYNLGLHLILIPLGFLIAPVNIKKIFMAFLAVFMIGNLFQFSPEMAANHKFFNFFMLFGAGLSAYFLSIVWKKVKLLKPLVLISIFFLIFTGIIDFFPIFNDTKIELADYPKNPDIKWIIDNTPKDAVFLNSTYLYNPASIAGRKIFLGWPYFAWSAGYNTNQRDKVLKKMLTEDNLSENCNLLLEHNISYIQIDQTDPEKFLINKSFFKENFSQIYFGQYKNNVVYSVHDTCK